MHLLCQCSACVFEEVTVIWWPHVGWVLSPYYEETDMHVVHDWVRFPELCWLNRNHWVPGLVLAVLCFLVGGWSGLVWGFFVSTVLLYHGVFAVNSLCHLFGRRRYATPDQSRNNVWVAVVTLGEGWHNNHHHYQSSTNQGFFWWEIDVCYRVIQLLEYLGLVWGTRTPPLAVLLTGEEGASSARSRPVPVETGSVPQTSAIAQTECGEAPPARGRGNPGTNDVQIPAPDVLVR